VGADPVPDLSLPKTVLSSVDSLIGAGGIIQSSPQNLTLYNSAIALRLLGGELPSDELLARGGRTLSSYSFWSIQAQEAGAAEGQQDRAHDVIVRTHSDAYARLCSRKRASSMYFLHRIAQGAQDAHALSQGFSQDAQHDQGVSALLAVGFAKPVSAIQVARPTRVATTSRVADASVDVWPRGPVTFFLDASPVRQSLSVP